MLFIYYYAIMLFVISLVFIFLTRLRFPSKLSIAEVLRKRYGDRILKLVRKFEKTSIRNSLPQCNIKVILKSTKRLSALFRFKDVIPKELRSHLVYKFSCSSCNATYYGKTERHLNVRSGEHIGLSPLTGNRVACKPSAISDHLLLHEHNNSSFNDFSILCCENNAFKLSLRESILIKRDSPELNRNVSSMPLLLFN